MQVFERATNLTAMIGTGLRTVIPYLFGNLTSAAQRRAFLARRFPNGNPRSLQAAFNWVVQSRTAANTLQNLGQIPRLGNIPRDPAIPAATPFRVNVFVEFFEAGVDPGDAGAEPIVVHNLNLYLPDLVAGEDLRRLVGRQAVEELRFLRSGSPTSQGYDPNNFRFRVTSIVRR